ncbi:MAG: DUF359 domain-containing protein [Archaeoglobaceae archaeon]|nr:DUF359 domain-containing protein [Archaeoglobaceae archaeon]MDW7989162.1 DUF359 domain-containing protein [Archaeoglobaceae archaeon]
MLKLPESLRKELSRPHGRVYKNGEKIFERIEEIKKSLIFACVGDFVSYCAFLASLRPNIVVIDGKTLRKKNLRFEVPKDYKKIETKNPPGFITSELIRVLMRSVELSMAGNRVAVIVDGEEDLAVMPLALLMPENSVIFYGQPGEGVVALYINKDMKDQILKFLKQMVVVEESEELRNLGVI